MSAALPLGEMTITEKLRAMEELWDDLCHQGAAITSPLWHGDVLAERKQLISEGKASFSDWEEVRRRLPIERSRE